MKRWRLGVALWITLTALLVGSVSPVSAQEIGHYGKNTLDLEAVGDRWEGAIGKGIIEYRGGDEPSSRWRASFRFSELSEETDYTVVVKGRFGDDGSDEASEYTALCSFETDSEGKGNCFWYFRGLARLNAVQLRLEDEDGTRVMQASRNGDLGSISTEPNRYSPGGEIPSRSAKKQGGSQ